jgi:hypothetical protein
MGAFRNSSAPIPHDSLQEFEFATKIQIILMFCDNFNNFFDVPNIQKPGV